MTKSPFLTAATLGMTVLLAPPLAAAVNSPPPQTHTGNLVGASGARIGTIALSPAPGGVLVRVEARGLTPGWHGMHLHAVADCAGPGFKTAGAHINHGTPPAPHGLLNPQGPDAGDLPNLFVHSDGAAQAEVFTTLVRLGDSGATAAVPNLLDADGSALVIHTSPDDHLSQPIGGAGDRVACALIKGR